MRFLDENYRGKSKRTKSEAKRLLEKHLSPTQARKKLSEITDAQVGNCLDRVKAPSERLHTYRAARTLLRWATRSPHRFIPHSPLEGFQAPHKDGSRERVLFDKELVAVWLACEGQFGTMIRLLILLGLRRGEVAKLKWEWVKSNIASELIACIPENGDFLFPGRWDSNTHFNDGSWGKLKNQLDQRVRLPLAVSSQDERNANQPWTIHDLRRTFSTNLAKLGVSQTVTEKLLNHVSGGSQSPIAQVYNRHTYAQEKADALSLSGDFMLGCRAFAA